MKLTDKKGKMKKLLLMLIALLLSGCTIPVALVKLPEDTANWTWQKRSGEIVLVNRNTGTEVIATRSEARLNRKLPSDVADAHSRSIVSKRDK